MITLAVPMRPHVVIGRGVNGLPTAALHGVGDGTCYDATSGDAIPCPGYGGTDSNQPYLQDSTPLYPGPSTPANTPASTPGTPTNWAALLQAIGAASGGAATAIRATQSPYYLPGSNTLYNPATGQLTNQVGVTATSVTPMIIGVVLIGAVLLFALKKG